MFFSEPTQEDVQQAIDLVAIAHQVDKKKAAAIYWNQALPLAAVHDGTGKRKRGRLAFYLERKINMG